MIKTVGKTKNKLSDFIDRIDFFVFIPSIKTELSDSDLLCDAFYLSIALIRKHFEFVKKIEVAALISVMAIISESRTRRIAESIVFLTKCPNDTNFEFKHLPLQAQKKFKSLVKDALGFYYEIIPKDE